MAYIVKKIIHGKPYYYLRVSKRIGGKVVSKNIAYFGKKRPLKKEVESKLIEIRKIKKVKQVNVRKNKDKIFKADKKTNTMISINDMAVFCKKKGFVFPNSEIYGGMSGFFDYGPLGVELKNNIKNELWNRFVRSRSDIVGIDGSIITNPKIWKASGHVDSFTDYIYRCSNCNLLVKGDDDKGIKCHKCGAELKSDGEFNLMFTTNVGPEFKDENKTYLRPETAQLIFADYKLVQESSRKKLPFGIAQAGKAFRNEISPRDFLFRSREFEQFEIEFFVHPDKVNDCPFIKDFEDMKVQILTIKNQKNKEEHSEMTIKDVIKGDIASRWHAYWLAQFYNFFLSLGIKKENLRLREHLKDELAHYATACLDIEYKFPFGWKEIHGDADRGQFDLKQHINLSKNKLEYFDEETKENVIPYVAAEPSQGIDRAFLAFLFEAYNDDKERGNIVLRLNPKLAPIKIGVFPLVNKLEKESKELFDNLKEKFAAVFDRSGSVGRRYARADEQGIPYCITFDFDSLKDKTITIRDRESTSQIRIKIKEITGVLDRLLNQDIRFEEAGRLVK